MISLIIAIGACGGEEPSGITAGTGTGGGTTGGTGPQKPVIDADVKTITCADSVAVTGQAEANMRVYSVNGGGGGATDDVDGSGRFCLAVALQPGANSIEVRTQDKSGKVSPPAMLSIERSGDCSGERSGETGGGLLTEPRNVATSAQIVASSAGEHYEGDPLQVMIDGDPDTWSKYTFPDDEGRIKLSFSKAIQIERIVVRWQAGETSHVGQYWGVDVSLNSNTDIDDDDQWTSAWKTETFSGAVQQVLLSEKPTVREVRIRLDEDNGWNRWEKYSIAEIEVWEAPKPKPDQNGATCH